MEKKIYIDILSNKTISNTPRSYILPLHTYNVPGGDVVTKTQFINKLKSNYVNLDHVSSRVLDYKYYEYLLFQILISKSSWRL